MWSRLEEKLQRRGIRLIGKICKAQRIVPSSHILQEECIHIGGVHYHGGFADVSEGRYQGHTVAIKHLRINGDPEGIFKVPFTVLTKPLSLNLRPAAVPRGRCLEIFIPPEYFTLAGGLFLCRPAFFPHSHSLDAKREC